MSLLRRVISGLMLALAVAGCAGSYEQRVHIADTSRATQVLLAKKSTQGRICYLRVEASGSSKTVVTIQLVLDGRIMEERVVSGIFRTEIATDWYWDKAEIRCQSRDASQGDCDLRFMFYEFKKA